MRKKGNNKNPSSNGRIGAIVALASLVFLAMILLLCPVLACGPFLPEVVFSHTRRPDLPLTRYAAGELGIVQPTFARSYLAVAYLYFSNHKLTKDQQQQATNMWWHRLTDRGTTPLYTPEMENAETQWRTARKKVNIPVPADFDYYRHISKENYTNYLNFQLQAYSTAAATLNSQLQSSKDGGKDPAVKDWVTAQDRIFAISSEPGTDADHKAIPDPLLGDANPVQKANREYQIASAHFYTQHFDLAEQEFSTIAANKNSPWCPVAPYMVARTLVRAATLAPSLDALTDQFDDKMARTMTGYDCLKKAQSAAQGVIASKEESQYHDAARGLLGYIKAQRDPTARAQELSRQLLNQQDSTLGNDLADYSILLDVLSPEPDPDANTPTTWDWQSRTPSAAVAVALLAAALLMICLWIRNQASELGSDVACAKIANSPWMHLLALILCAAPFLLSACTSTPPLLSKSPDHAGKNKPTKAPPVVPSDEMSRWILNYQLKTKDAAQKAYSEWKRSGSNAWLVSAVSKIDASDQHAAEVLAAAAKVPASSAAYITLAFHRIRLLTASEKRGEAYTILKSLLALPEAQLPPSARNLLMEQGLGLVHDMDEFKKFAFLSPSSIGVIEDVDAVPTTDSASTLKQLQSGDRFLDNPRCLTKTAADVINFALPLSLTQTLLGQTSLPQPLRLDIAQAGWVRSAMLKQDAQQKAFAQALQEVRPQLGKSLDEYNKAAPGAGKDFLFASIVLKNPAMRPYVTFGSARQTAFDTLDDYSNNWWSEQGVPGSYGGDSDSDDASKKKALPAVYFLTDVQKKTATEELASIKSKGNAPDYLCKLVIAWADLQPHDPRLAESLYRAIRATKVGSTDSDTSKLSKKAFLILHKNFPGNEWTKKTPYFY